MDLHHWTPQQIGGMTLYQVGIASGGDCEDLKPTTKKLTREEAMALPVRAR